VKQAADEACEHQGTIAIRLRREHEALKRSRDSVCHDLRREERQIVGIQIGALMQVLEQQRHRGLHALCLPEGLRPIGLADPVRLSLGSIGVKRALGRGVFVVHQLDALGGCSQIVKGQDAMERPG
jgi:hypothetical protein